MTMQPRKRIALVAHDGQKSAIIEWAEKEKEILSQHELWGTGTTGTRVAEATNLNINRLKSGPFGGDQQLGAMIAEGQLDVLIFFTDPLAALPHDVDVKALMRISTLNQTVIACNRATADFVVQSELLKKPYTRSEIVTAVTPVSVTARPKASASKEKPMSSKLLMIVGDFVEDYELMVPFQALGAVGFDVHAVCPNKTAGETIKTAIHDFEGDQTYTEKPGHNFAITHDFDSVDLSSYAGLIVPGGRAPEYLRLDERVLEMVEYFLSADKPIASDLSWRTALGRNRGGALKGRQISAYSACAPEVRLAGATYVDIDASAAITDGKIVTAPAWPAHPAWLSQFMLVLGVTISGVAPRVATG